MAGNTFGNIFKVTTFGESHGEALGCILDGVPSQLDFDLEFLQSEMDRRRPGGNSLGTARKEMDKVHVLSGVFEGKTTGTPITLVVYNENQHSKDYSAISNVFRPGHADYTFTQKYKIRDYRGGGRSSGRETLARVAAGAVAKMYLKTFGISITAGTIQLGHVKASPDKWEPPFLNELSTPDEEAFPLMKAEIENARLQQDSVGGIIELHIEGCPPGLGEPVFDKLDAKLGYAMFSIGAVKGVEFGQGFNSASLLGSQNNDAMTMVGDNVRFYTNNAGGILGGISNGDSIVMRIAIKPTPSISQEQTTVNEKGEDVKLVIKGRHDPSIVPRAVVVTEAMAALTIADEILAWRAYE